MRADWCDAQGSARARRQGLQPRRQATRPSAWIMTVDPHLDAKACVAAVALLLACAPVAAEEQIAMPLGALVCKAIETTIEHARIVRQPTTAGLREFVEAQVASGACRMVKVETSVGVIDVDQRGYALIDDGRNGQGWTDAENLWGYFDTPNKVKTWKKP